MCASLVINTLQYDAWYTQLQIELKDLRRFNYVYPVYNKILFHRNGT